MADEEYLGLPLLGEMLGVPDVPPRRRESDLLDYYLGPTGIPDRLGAANELLNPIVGLSDAMYYSGRAFSPDLTPEQRREAAMEAVLGTSLAAAPIPAAKVLQRYMRAMPRGTALADEADEAASAIAETLTGATVPAGQVVGTVNGEPFLTVNPLREDLDYDPYEGLVFDADGRPEIYNHRVIADMDDAELRSAVEDLVLAQDYGAAQDLSRAFALRGRPDPLDEILMGVITSHQEMGNWDAADEVNRVIAARLTDQGFDDADPNLLDDYDYPLIDDVSMYYSTNTPLLADETTPFFSTVRRALQDLPQDKYGDAGQFLAALERAGARPGEIDALDLKSLALQGGPVDRRVISEQLASRITNEGLGDVRILDADGGYRSFFPSSKSPTNYRERVIALPLSEYPEFKYATNLLGETRSGPVPDHEPPLYISGEFRDLYMPPHFAQLAEESDTVPIMHYRTGIFETDDGLRTLHLGEIQSDIVQGQRGQARMKAIYDRNKDLFDEYKKRPTDDSLNNLYRGLRNTPEIDPDKDDLPELIFNINQREVLGYNKPPSAKLPVAGTTDKFTQLGIRAALMDALEADVDYLTFPFPDEVQRATFGKEEGQIKYYGKIVPKNLFEVLKDIKKRSGMDIPVSTDISTSRINPDSMGDGSAPVRFGIRLTPEVKEAIRKAGLPLYRDGGLVTA